MGAHLHSKHVFLIIYVSFNVFYAKIRLFITNPVRYNLFKVAESDESVFGCIGNDFEHVKAILRANFG